MNAYTVGSARILVTCAINRLVARVISRDMNAYTVDSVPVCVLCIINCSSSGVYVELSNVCSVTWFHSCILQAPLSSSAETRKYTNESIFISVVSQGTTCLQDKHLCYGLHLFDCYV
jgi:hypothetical protein